MAANSLPTPDALRHALRVGFDATGLVWPPVKIAVALSGGADSLVLTLLARQLTEQDGIALCTFTVDHRLRPESAAEAQQVQKQMRDLGIPHRILLWEHVAVEGNLPAAARAARYALLTAACREEGIPALLLGHHADDQAETLLHQLIRGSGVDGLSAMPHARLQNGIALLRPLLGFPKTALEAVCRAQNAVWVEDPSNHDPRFARTMLRRFLEEFSANGFSSARLSETAAHMARARLALEEMTANLLHTKRETEGGFILSLPLWRAAPEEIRLRALRVLATELGDAEPPRFEALARLAEAMMQVERGRQTLHRLIWEWENEEIRVRHESTAPVVQVTTLQVSLADPI